jgi:hypothetical protein
MKSRFDWLKYKDFKKIRTLKNEWQTNYFWLLKCNINRIWKIMIKCLFSLYKWKFLEFFDLKKMKNNIESDCFAFNYFSTKCNNFHIELGLFTLVSKSINLLSIPDGMKVVSVEWCDDCFSLESIDIHHSVTMFSHICFGSLSCIRIVQCFWFNNIIDASCLFDRLI